MMLCIVASYQLLYLCVNLLFGVLADEVFAEPTQQCGKGDSCHSFTIAYCSVWSTTTAATATAAVEISAFSCA